jgi:hypothetical protein
MRGRVRSTARRRIETGDALQKKGTQSRQTGADDGGFYFDNGEDGCGCVIVGRICRAGYDDEGVETHDGDDADTVPRSSTIEVMKGGGKEHESQSERK